jgi:hypothetical protein
MEPRYLDEVVHWEATGGIFVPFQARVGEAIWALRLNEFPERPMYTLFIDGMEIGTLDDPPHTWHLPHLWMIQAAFKAAWGRTWLAPWIAEVSRRAFEE